MKLKHLRIYRDGEHIQTVTFMKDSDISGWTATNFNREKYMPFSLHHSANKMKQILIAEGLTWDWI